MQVKARKAISARGENPLPPAGLSIWRGLRAEKAQVCGLRRTTGSDVACEGARDAAANPLRCGRRLRR